MAGIAMGLKCPVCAAEDRADSEYESARSDNKADGAFQAHPQGGVLFGSPLRRGSSAYHLCQVRHRRRFLMEAKNHAVATRRLLGQAPNPSRQAADCMGAVGKLQDHQPAVGIWSVDAIAGSIARIGPGLGRAKIAGLISGS